MFEGFILSRCPLHRIGRTARREKQQKLGGPFLSRYILENDPLFYEVFLKKFRTLSY